MIEKNTFDHFGFSPDVLDAVARKGFQEPTTIQNMTIPLLLHGEMDIIAQAQTGTGKTAAFGLPLIERIDENARGIQALILVPTRELAIQVSEEIRSLTGRKNLKTTPIYGGQSIVEQLRTLKKGVHIVVGTPGRILDHLSRRTLKLGDLAFLILDEADEMLNMGFIDDIEEIMAHTNSDKRTLLFSATMPPKIKNLAQKYLNDYEFLKVKKESLTTHLTEQLYFEVNNSNKFEALCRIIDMEEPFYGLVFCRTKNDAHSVAGHLIDRGYEAEAIHGDISQAQRERTLKNFRKQRVRILVATDVAARGIDVTDMTHVVNYALPHDPESYVHRIGRTGRAGKRGTAISFVAPGEHKRLQAIQRFAKVKIQKSRLPKVDEILAAKKRKIEAELATTLNGEIASTYFHWAKQLLGEYNPTEILAALLSTSFKDKLDPQNYNDILSPAHASSRRSKKQEDDVRLFVALGKKDKMNPEKLVKLIASRAPVKSRQIRDVQVMDKFSFVTVPFNKAEKIVGLFQAKGQRPLITHAR